jgi:VanZ family protein
MEVQATTSGTRSPTLITCALVYLFLIVYASYYPFSGWRDNGVSSLAFFSAGMPKYWTWFDVVTNVLAYIPLGGLGVLLLYPTFRGLFACFLVILLGATLSAGLEMGQTYLPSRVPSVIDWLTNVAGTALGTVAGVLLTGPLLADNRLRQLRQRWLVPEASLGIAVLMLWPLAQIYPQGYLFGHGQLLPVISNYLFQWTDVSFDLSEWLRQGRELSVQQYWLAETIIVAFGFTGVQLSLLCLLRKSAPKTLLLIMMMSIGLLMKSLACALFFTPENAFVWLTPGAQGGCLIGLIMLSGLVYARPVAQRRLAGLTLLLSVVLINLIPVNPYFAATLQTWVQGKFLNFNGAAQILSLFWPFLALWFLWNPANSPNRN